MQTYTTYTRFRNLFSVAMLGLILTIIFFFQTEAIVAGIAALIVGFLVGMFVKSFSVAALMALGLLVAVGTSSMPMIALFTGYMIAYFLPRTKKAVPVVPVQE